jgi:hypothetical protein
MSAASLNARMNARILSGTLTNMPEYVDYIRGYRDATIPVYITGFIVASVPAIYG